MAVRPEQITKQNNKYFRLLIFINSVMRIRNGIVIPKIKMCVKKSMESEILRKIDFLIEGDFASESVNNSTQGSQAYDAISPKWPASIKPASLGENMYRAEIKSDVDSLNLNSFLATR
jgi:hypothetical protein